MGKTASSGMSVLLDKMATAMKEFEGWTVGSRSYRNNNPGNLKFAGQAGAIGQDDEGHAIFDSYDSGWAALIHQLSMYFNGTSSVIQPENCLYTLYSHYAEANSVEYAEYVGQALGVDPSLSLAQIQAFYTGVSNV